MGQVEEILDDGGVLFQTIFEMVGKPKEHIEKGMHDYIETIKKDPIFIVHSAEIAEVDELEDTDNLFSTFAELEVVAKTHSQVLDFIFKYMPASIQIIEPEEIKLSSNDATGLFNDLIAKLHEFDMHAKTTNQQINILTQSAQTLAKNAIILSLNLGLASSKDISAAVGFPEEQLIPLLDQLVESRNIAKVEGKYGLIQPNNPEPVNKPETKTPKKGK